MFANALIIAKTHGQLTGEFRSANEPGRTPQKKDRGVRANTAVFP